MKTLVICIIGALVAIFGVVVKMVLDELPIGDSGHGEEDKS